MVRQHHAIPGDRRGDGEGAGAGIGSGLRKVMTDGREQIGLLGHRHAHHALGLPAGTLQSEAGGGRPEIDQEALRASGFFFGHEGSAR